MGKTKRKEEPDSQNKKQPRPAGDEETEPKKKKKKVLSEASQDECRTKSDKNKGNADTDPKKKKLKRSAEDEQPARESEPKKNKDTVLSEVSEVEGSRTIRKNKGNAGTDSKKKRLRRSAEGEQPARAAPPKKNKTPVRADASRDGEVSSASRRGQKPAAQMTEEDLTAEEVRVFERKLKKERKKEEKKVRREAGAEDAPDAERPSGAALALRYLQSWSERAPGWRFQKTRQTWLLLRMYDARQLPDQHFELLLRYLEGLRGGARELTVHQAEALMKELEHTEDRALLGKMDRARQVLQLLS